MSVRVTREEDTLRISNSRLEFEVELATLRMALRSSSGATRWQGFRPRVVTERGALLANESVLDGSGTLRTRSGVATRLHLENRLSARLWLCTDIELGEDWPGVALRFTLANRGIRSVRVDAIDAVSWSEDEDESELSFQHPRGTQILEMGFHSDAPARWRKLGTAPWLQPFSRARVDDRGPFTPAPAWGLHVSDFVTSLRGCRELESDLTREAPAEGITVGFMSHDRFLSFVYAHSQGGRIHELTASCFTEALQLPPRTRLAAEKLWLGVDLPNEDGLANWASYTGQEMQAPVPGRQLAGCVSAVGAGDLEAMREALAQAGRFRTSDQCAFEVASAYAPWIGDWLAPSRAFPQGAAALVEDIRSAGLTPRIWIAPFLVAARSDLVERHPDWVLRDTDGAPVSPACSLPDEWGEVWILDASNLQVIDWLQKLGDSLRGLGFDQIALRHLDVGLQPGARKRPELGTAEVYRQALVALRGRVESGSSLRLVAERAPIGPSVGLVDGVRCGPHWGPHWSPRLGTRGVDPGGSAEVALRNMLVRAPLHQRLWTHEIGPLQLSPADSDLGADERLSLAVLAAASGSPVAICDPPGALETQSIGLFQQLCPASGRSAEPLDTDNDGLVTRFPDGSVLLFRLNFSRRARSWSIDLRRLGVTESVYAWDILQQKFLPTSDGTLEIREIPGHGCAWVRLTPIDDRPRVVGSGLHLCGGALEVSRLRVLPSGAVAVRLQLAGSRFGELWVTRNSSAPPIGACVAFSGNLEFALSEITPEPEEEP